MGIVLSCLKGDEEETHTQHTERTPLLGPGANSKQEELAAETRQKELEGIVHDLTENLIDVSTFLQGDNEENEEEEEEEEEEEGTSHGAPTPLPPALVTEDFKRSLRQISSEALIAINRELEVKPSGPLVLNFSQ